MGFVLDGKEWSDWVHCLSRLPLSSRPTFGITIHFKIQYQSVRIWPFNEALRFVVTSYSFANLTVFRMMLTTVVDRLGIVRNSSCCASLALMLKLLQWCYHGIRKCISRPMKPCQRRLWTVLSSTEHDSDSHPFSLTIWEKFSGTTTTALFNIVHKLLELEALDFRLRTPDTADLAFIPYCHLFYTLDVERLFFESQNAKLKTEKTEVFVCVTGRAV